MLQCIDAPLRPHHDKSEPLSVLNVSVDASTPCVFVAGILICSRFIYVELLFRKRVKTLTKIMDVVNMCVLGCGHTLAERKAFQDCPLPGPGGSKACCSPSFAFIRAKTIGAPALESALIRRASSKALKNPT